MVIEVASRTHVQRIDKVVGYIQNHLEQSMTIDELANVACFSSYHFHRIFTAYTGEPLQVFVRRLRIQKAMKELLYSNLSITDIALSCGYQSQTSFNKAFKQMTALSPSQFRQKGKMDVQLSIEKQTQYDEVLIMKPEFVEFSETKVLYLRLKGKYEDIAPRSWRGLFGYAKQHHLLNEDTRYFAIAHDDPNVTIKDKCRYDACLTITEEPEDLESMSIATLEQGKYAVFNHEKEEGSLEPIFNEIFSKWYPESGCELRNIPCFVECMDIDMNNPQTPKTGRFQIYIPIQ